jgi:hypothetical protein
LKAYARCCQGGSRIPTSTVAIAPIRLAKHGPWSPDPVPPGGRGAFWSRWSGSHTRRVEALMHDVPAGITAGIENTKPRGLSMVRGGPGVATRTDTKTGSSMRPLSQLACKVIQVQPRTGDVVFANRSGGPIVGYRKMWLRVAKLGDLSADITPHVLRHSFANLAAGRGYSEPTIASLIQRHQQISPFSRCRPTSRSGCHRRCQMKLMEPAQPQLRK